MGRVRWVSVLFVLLSLAPGLARAHEVGGTRFDAPIPLSLLFGGAGATVALTAVWLGYADTSISNIDARRLTTVSERTAIRLRLAARTLFFVAVLAALVHGLFGRQVGPENLATVFVWAVWLKGVGLIAALAGSPWRVLSPWRTLYDLLARVEGDDIALLGTYPQRLGRWPALVGFVLGVGVLENLTVVPRSPTATVTVVAGYALVMLLGAVAFGREWFGNADALEVLYALFGRVAPLDIAPTESGDYLLRLRPLWRGPTRPVAGVGSVVFVIATVYTVSFDGFTSTPEFQTLLFGTRETLKTGSGTAIALYVLGLLGFVGSFFLASTLAEWFGQGGVSERRGNEAVVAFAPSVLPIAVTYEIAHNYPFVARNLGQALGITIGLVRGVSPQPISLLGWLPLPAFWGSQVLLIVVGHLVAVVAAHLVAVRRYRTPVAARRGHLPLVVVMVGYTVLSLWIVSRPVVT